ncbi:putative double-stranded binding protein [Operophtera brumata]|uniref:Putative double-stranded binding protein n=1 Tax=Operophtera brumata TaxID=104452 RepID=A0A0L7L5B6_OPEBR|nr:putative double-stranded binding protein [Operophtera brumata]
MSDTIESPPAKRAKIKDDTQNSQDSQNYGLHVTPEEVQKLREFQVLDEVKSDDEDSNDEGSDKTDSSNEKGINYFEVLPLDWMMVRHSSGMPIYMHRASRVCTLAKPYFLGKGNTRRHDIPISAIPCLAYRIALKEEQKQMEIDRQIAEQIKNGTWAEPQQHDPNKARF